MAVIAHSKLEKFLVKKEAPAPIYLIFGDTYLCAQAFDALTAALLPEEHRDFGLDTLEGAEDDIYEALERVNTFSLDSAPKVVALRDSRIFYSKSDDGKLIGRIKEALADDKPDRAAGPFLKLLALQDLDLDSLGKEEKEKLLAADPDGGNKDDWLEIVIDHCRQAGVAPSPVSDPAAALQQAVAKGFAPANHLVITTDVVDKRRRLFKTIQEHGHVIDCSVAAGDTKAARQAQQSALADLAKTVLERRGKNLEPAAFQGLSELTGFDPGTFHNHLEKLAAYVGDRPAITADDVKRLARRTRTDPIYTLTNAVFDRDRTQALYYLESLLSGSEAVHPLQVLAALINQVRKLLIIRDFMDSAAGRSWQAKMRFDAFKRQVMPAVEQHDAAAAEKILRHDRQLAGEDPDATTPPKKSAPKKPPADLMIAAGSGNPYPVYMNFKKAAGFTRSELLSFYPALQQADRRLKTLSDKDPAARFVLESLIIKISGCPSSQ
ncbi:MAG: DNA polymerase III subunit delta [Desulfosudaceae bacterium]